MAGTKSQFIAAELRSSLGAPGDPIPSESEIVRTWGVSRGTARRAINELREQGLISGGQGSRPVVRDDRRWIWDMTAWEDRERHTREADAWARNISDQGGTPDTSVTIEILDAGAEQAEQLGVEPGSIIYRRGRVRSIDGCPHMLQDSFFPKWVVEKIPELSRPGDQSAPGGLLAASGLEQVRLHDEVTARMPTPEESERLYIPRGTALLINKRVGYDEKGRPIRLMVTRMSASSVMMTWDIDLKCNV